MISSTQARNHYGNPEKESSMVVWDVPTELEVGAIPNKIYCNKDMVKPLTKAFQNVKDRGLGHLIRTWDGCFNIRRQRGSATASLHSWGLAIDINAAWNGLGKTPKIEPELVKCFTDAGFIWGGVWRRPDGMHFELAEIPK